VRERVRKRESAKRRGYLISLPSCVCDNGWSGSNCQTAVCVDDCSGNGLCVASGQVPVCSCFAGFQPPSCANLYLIPTNVTVPPTSPPSSDTPSTSPGLTLTPPPTSSSSKKKKKTVSPMIIGVATGGAILLVIVIGVVIYVFHGRLITLVKTDSDPNDL